MMDDQKTVIDILFLACIAFVGGALKYSSSLGRKKFSIAQFIICAATSGFMGLIVAFIGFEVKWSIYWMGAMCGVSGWLGPAFVMHLIKAITTLPTDTDENNKAR